MKLFGKRKCLLVLNLIFVFLVYAPKGQAFDIVPSNKNDPRGIYTVFSIGPNGNQIGFLFCKNYLDKKDCDFMGPKDLYLIQKVGEERINELARMGAIIIVDGALVVGTVVGLTEAVLAISGGASAMGYFAVDMGRVFANFLGYSIGIPLSFSATALIDGLNPKEYWDTAQTISDEVLSGELQKIDDFDDHYEKLSNILASVKD